MSDFEPWVKVPHAIVLAPISEKSKVLFLVLAMYRNNETGLAWPGLETLAEVMGCSVSSVRRARKELETFGAIDSRQRWNATTVYTVNVSGVLTGENKSVTGETKSVTGENKSVTGEHLTRTSKLEPIELEPIKLIDPRDSGQTLIKTLESELYKLMSSGNAPSYETQRNYGDPLERLALAIELDPDGVEKTLKRKTAGAKHLAAYIEKTLLNNPHTLMEDCEELYDMTLDELEDMARGELEEFTPTRPPAPISGPKTTSPGTTTPAPSAPAQRAPDVAGVSPDNLAWLGSLGKGGGAYAIRCAQVATELGLTIPEGVEEPQAGQLLARAKKLMAAGEQLENPSSEMWQGRETLKAHKVTITG
jgi:hypothetical protein